MRDSHAKISVNLEGVLPVVRERFKNETVATFYDVCGVSGSKNDQFSIFAFGLKVINLLKQKWKRFVKENPQRSEMDNFGSI